jgi:hypothetical protein
VGNQRNSRKKLAAHHCMHQEFYTERSAVRNQHQTASAMAQLCWKTCEKNVKNNYVYTTGQNMKTLLEGVLSPNVTVISKGRMQI